MVELLKSTKYAKIIDAKIPNKETQKAIDDVEKGRLKSYHSVEAMMGKLKKDSGV